MIETDVLFAHLKEKDWLKESAETILKAVDTGKAKAYASRESIHELHYLMRRTGAEPSEVTSKVGALTMIKNLTWPPTTTETDLLALSLVATYRMTSIFDAYHAATCLLWDSELTIVSTDSVYDNIPQLKRKDPRDLAKTLSAK